MEVPLGDIARGSAIVDDKSSFLPWTLTLGGLPESGEAIQNSFIWNSLTNWTNVTHGWKAPCLILVRRTTRRLLGTG